MLLSGVRAQTAWWSPGAWVPCSGLPGRVRRLGPGGVVERGHAQAGEGVASGGSRVRSVLSWRSTRSFVGPVAPVEAEAELEGVLVVGRELVFNHGLTPEVVWVGSGGAGGRRVASVVRRLVWVRIRFGELGHRASRSSVRGRASAVAAVVDGHRFVVEDRSEPVAAFGCVDDPLGEDVERSTLRRQLVGVAIEVFRGG